MIFYKEFFLGETFVMRNGWSLPCRKLHYLEFERHFELAFLNR
jgi:hypothetical protein